MTTPMIVKTYEHQGLSIEVSFTQAAFFNATKVAQVFGKRPTAWLVLDSTKEYLEAVTRKMVTEESQLVRVKQGGKDQGTWLHPKLGVRFAQWCDVNFAVWCDEAVDDILRGTSTTTLLLSEQQTLSEIIHAKARTAPDALYRKAVSEIWSRFKNKFRVPRYADLPRDQLTDAILYVNALELRCMKRLEADGTPPFLQGEIGTRLLIRLEGGGRYSVTPLGLTELVVDLADLVAIDQALDTWRDFAKRKELGYYRAGVANLRSNRP